MPPVAPIGPAVPVPIPGIPIPARSITIALVIVLAPSSRVSDDRRFAVTDVLIIAAQKV
jgi:hypothetical protein